MFGSGHETRRLSTLQQPQNTAFKLRETSANSRNASSHQHTWSQKVTKCHVCGAVGGRCPCPRADSAPVSEKERRLQALEAHTVHGRTRLYRTVASVDRTQMEARLALATEEDRCFAALCALQQATERLYLAVAEEATGRGAVIADCRRGYNGLHYAREALSLLREEQEWRRGLSARQEEARLALRAWALDAQRYVDVAIDESLGRRQLQATEEGYRGRIQDHRAAHAARLSDCAAERYQVAKVLLAKRDDMQNHLLEQADGLLQRFAEHLVDLLEGDRQKRGVQAAEASCRHGLAFAEATARGELSDDMIAHRQWVLEQLHAFDAAVSQVVSEEENHRRHLVDYEADRLQRLWGAIQADRDTARAEEQRRIGEVGAFVTDALEVLDGLAEREHAAFTNILTRQRTEHVHVQHLRYRHQRQRERFIQRVNLYLGDLRTAESSARASLRDALLEGARAIREAAIEHEIRVEELLTAEEDARLTVEEERRSDLYALFERMAERAAAVELWIDQLSDVRTQFGLLELDARWEVVLAAEDECDALWTWYREETGAVTAALQRAHEARLTMEREVLVAVDGVYRLEDQRWAELLRLEATGCLRAFVRQHARECAEVDDAEYAARRAVVGDETDGWVLIVQTAQESRFAAFEAYRRMLVCHVDDCERDEREARAELAGRETGEFRVLLVDAAHSSEVARRDAAHREHQELLDRQQQMQEDERRVFLGEGLPDEELDSSLAEVGRASFAAFRRSTAMAETPHRRRPTQTSLADVADDWSDLQRDFVVQRLHQPAAARCSRAQLAAIATLLDGLDQASATLRDEQQREHQLRQKLETQNKRLSQHLEHFSSMASLHERTLETRTAEHAAQREANQRSLMVHRRTRKANEAKLKEIEKDTAALRDDIEDMKLAVRGVPSGARPVAIRRPQGKHR